MEDQLTILLGRFVQDLGATVSAGNVLIGDELGLYRALAEAGPFTAAELAAYTGTAERYVREWLPGQAAGGYVSYDTVTDRYWLNEAQAVAFADPDGPAAARRVPARAGLPGRPADDRRRVPHRPGVAWGAHDPGVFTGCERFFRPGYVANLVSSLDPGRARAGRPAHRGHRRSPTSAAGSARPPGIIADTYPASSVRGFDSHPAVGRAGPRAASTPTWPDRCTSRRGPGLPGHRVRPGDHVRLPARHGRPGRRGPAHPGRARRRRDLADRRAVRGRRGRGEPHPGRPGLLQLLHVPVRAARASPRAPRTRSATRPARRRSARSSRRPGSVRSAGWQRPRSTWCTRPARDRCRAGSPPPTTEAAYVELRTERVVPGRMCRQAAAARLSA